MTTAVQVEKKTISVIIIEDFKLTRVGLRCALNSNEDINVVAESDNAIDGLELIKHHTPDIVLMDLGLAGMNGIEATLKVKEMNKNIKVIALTSHDREEEVIAALSSGAMAYCLKDIDPSKLADVIRDVVDGLIPSFLGCCVGEVVVAVELHAEDPCDPVFHGVHGRFHCFIELRGAVERWRDALHGEGGGIHPVFPV